MTNLCEKPVADEAFLTVRHAIISLHMEVHNQLDHGHAVLTYRTETHPAAVDYAEVQDHVVVLPTSGDVLEENSDEKGTSNLWIVFQTDLFELRFVKILVI